ncbi:hypothetical protein [Zhenhengia yiwuensis]|uniref:Uncharacterized protein n=1 Tax=Zhenhengia yiwuensis TaxID=2763666 RepID=A0A926EHI9_9FIRM|nr:hypothetical protein [Zhenhengia yiwuensis]MBC8580474.1 hypothetical protein [Zhenhengia yiwuensis]
MIACQSCDRIPEKHECGRCRQVLKHELAEIVRGEAKIYLDENSRNKKGRPSKIKDSTFQYNVAKRYKELNSYRKVGEEFGLSKGTVAKIIKIYGSNLKYVK